MNQATKQRKTEETEKNGKKQRKQKKNVKKTQEIKQNQPRVKLKHDQGDVARKIVLFYELRLDLGYIDKQYHNCNYSCTNHVY